MMALHGAGKLHRDIKPSNVLVASDGRVVILDFGVATDLARVVDENLSEAHEVVGTARYMAPEQALSEAPTAASDWYSVGAVLYEALVGRTPFVGSAIDVLTLKTLNDPMSPAECVDGIPPELDSLCRALLDRDPDKRPGGPEILERIGGTPSRPVTSLHPPADPPRATALVGREKQLAEMRDAFEGVLAGRQITLRIAGASGMGKSALAAHFLDGLVESGEAVVLRGRAYERESLPYKAVDTVIDALSRYLVHLEAEGETIEVPADIGALARVFPVLKRVASIGDVAEPEVTDPNLVRRRAFAALRELLRLLSARRPIVLYIDDVQWGDTDSSALLLDLVRPPSAPPVLFVMTHRNERSQSSSFLEEMRERWPEGAESREISVGALAPADGQRLAMTLLGSSDEIAQRTARAAARESGGNPFLIEELVRSNSNIVNRPAGETLTTLTLDQMVAQRLERLPDEARLLLEVLAVGGRPLPVSVVADASRLVGAQVEKAIASARARRLLRTGLRNGQETIEASHDRFGETIVAQLPAAKLREHHGSLARALEAAPGANTEAVSVHLLGAGDNARAALFAERAAEEAIAKLAFEQAARLLAVALDVAPGSPDDTRRLRTRLATVFVWAGRGEQAARTYLEAAKGAPPLQRAELERAASIELLASGRMVEGAAVLHRVLAAVGLSAPRSVLGAVFWLIVNRIRLALASLSGFRFQPPAGETPGLERARVDAAFSAGMGFAVTNVILGTCMTARSLLLALKFGDRFQVMRAAILEASQRAAMGGKQGKVERSLVDFAHRLAQDEGTPVALGFFDGNLGVSVYLRGEWKKALEVVDRSISYAEVNDHSAGWGSTARVFGCWALNFLGEHRQLAARHAAIVADAEQRGDLYTSVQLRDGSLAILWLVADDPEGARRHVQQAMSLWPDDRYLLQHWHRLYGEAEIELYVGDGAKAYARVDRDAGPLKRSLLLAVQHMRVQTMFLRGRCAIASLEAEPTMRAQRLDEARHLARQIEKENMGWSAPFGAILKACVASAEGNRAGAADALRSAIDLAIAADMAGYASAARYQLGALLGGEEGDALVSRAEEAMTAQGIRVPSRFAATLVPGRWRAA
jgi:hypothetical protein